MMPSFTDPRGFSFFYAVLLLLTETKTVKNNFGKTLLKAFMYNAGYTVIKGYNAF